ncbi:MAG: DUF3800 domain-containing protein, partial [Anaerohalosphaera sp.]|nr:DUF3800 domain-containing protein [Anaerohalosphaera sp.]
MEFSIFLDETGDHGLSYIDENFPLFLLCGCIIDNENLRLIEAEINSLKLKFFRTTEVVLHSRDIRKCEGVFQILFDMDIKRRFYEGLNYILSESTYSLIGSGVHKERHIKRYGKSAGNPYLLSLSFIVERLVFFLDRYGSDSSVHVFVEKRGKREDQQLLSHFNSICDKGTYYVSGTRIRNRIKHFEFQAKRDNVIGLQIADLCAYPLARHIINPKEPYVPFELIQNK